MPTPHRWIKRDASVIAPARIFDLLSVKYFHPARSAEKAFTVVEAPDWVNVVAVTDDHQVILVKQFRFGINEFSLEVPGGVIDSGEDPVAAGQRELAEETGYVGKSARLIGQSHPNPAFLNNRCHIVLVEHCRLDRDQHFDPDEEIEVSLLPVEDALRATRDGRITHSLVINALYFAAHEIGVIGT